MEANKSFSLGLTTIAQNAISQQKHFIKEIQNLQKVILQSFKYCQAKNSKNKYLKHKKVQQIKNYQTKLITLIKKKSQQIIQDLFNHSQKMIQQEQALLNFSQDIQKNTLIKLQQNLQTLKNAEKQQNKCIFDIEKIKKMTLQCQDQLQKMEGNFQDMNQRVEKQIVDEMEKPFKRYIKCLNIFKRDIQLSIENSKSLK